MAQTTMKRFWWLLLVLVACHAAPAEVTPVALPSQGWTVAVRSEGPRWLAPSWWAAQGGDPTAAGPLTLRRGDQPLPVRRFDAPQGRGTLLFPDVAAAGYVLQETAALSPTAPLPLAAPAAASPQTTTWATAHLERDLVYRSTAPVTPPWLWASLLAPSALTLTVPLTDALAAPVTVTVQVWGQSQAPQSPDHHLVLSWNGAEVSDHRWDGNGVESWSFVVPRGTAGDNQLVLSAPGDTGAPVEVTWLDWITVQWRRTLRFRRSWETWDTTAPTVCWEQVPPHAHVMWVNAGGAYDGGAVSPGHTCFTQPLHSRGWLGVPWQAPPPDVIRPREVLTGTAAAFVIVADRSFHEALAPLVAARTAEGVSVRVVTPEAVYDTFGDGRPTAAALRQLIAAWRGAGLRYLLLVGDASARYAWQPAPLIPTAWVHTSIVGTTASDERLAEDADEVPQVAVGRFPADKVADVRAMVAKTLAWSPTRRLLLLTDDESDFAALADDLAAIRPPEARFDASEDDARQETLRWLKAAPGVLVYAGHGSLPLLADEKLLTRQDAGAWDGPTVVALWTCLSATFTHPEQDGLGEVWLRAPRGVVALIGPTGETTTGDQRAMALAVQRSWAEGGRLGDALLAGWRASASADARRGFLLLGDPTLPLDADE